MEENKNNSKNILIAFLVVLVLGLSGFIIYDKIINKTEDNKQIIHNNNINESTDNSDISNNDISQDKEQNTNDNSNNLDLNGVWRQINGSNKFGSKYFKMENNEFSFGEWGTDSVKFCKYNKIEKIDDKKYKLYGSECYYSTSENDEVDKSEEVYEINYNFNNKSFELSSINNKKQDDLVMYYYAGKDFSDSEDFTFLLHGLWYSEDNSYFKIEEKEYTTGEYATDAVLTCDYFGNKKLENNLYELIANNCKSPGDEQGSNIKMNFKYNDKDNKITVIKTTASSEQKVYYYVGQTEKEIDDFEKIYYEYYNNQNPDQLMKKLGFYK